MAGAEWTGYVDSWKGEAAEPVAAAAKKAR